MTEDKQDITGKITIFLDGKPSFSVNGDFGKWRNKESISLTRKPPTGIEINDFPRGPQSPPRTIESKIAARIEIKDRQGGETLCILCYELIEPTRNQIVQDIVKIKQKLST